jgi:hypothetical protein
LSFSYTGSAIHSASSSCFTNLCISKKWSIDWWSQEMMHTYNMIVVMAFLWDILQLSTNFSIVSLLSQLNPWLMLPNLLISLCVPLTIPYCFNQLQCLFLDKLLDCCKRMLIVWNWDNKEPKIDSSSFSFMSIEQTSFVFAWTFKFWYLLVSPNLILWSRVFIPVLIVITQSLLVFSCLNPQNITESQTSVLLRLERHVWCVAWGCESRLVTEGWWSSTKVSPIGWNKVGIGLQSDIKSKGKWWQLWLSLCKRRRMFLGKIEV